MSGSGPAGESTSSSGNSSSSRKPDPALSPPLAGMASSRPAGESNSSCANSSSRKPDPAPPPNPSQQPEAAPDTPPPTWTVWYRPPERDWVPAFWAQQSRGAYAYDMASCALKVVLLIGNVKRSLDHGQLHAARCAAGAALLCALTIACMVLCQAQFARRRRLVMWSHLAAISIMMATSMPQFLSASPSPWLVGHRALILLFKMGVTWPMMAALMHRLPWQDLALVCSAFCLWLCATWVRPLCTHLQGSPGEAAFVHSLAGTLDRLTGLAAAGGAAGGEEWVGAPLAQHIADACRTAAAGSGGLALNSSSSSSVVAGLTDLTCSSLLMGQCMAVVTTLTLWVGVLVIMFCVVLAEQHSKWRWWRSSGVHWPGRAPSAYSPTSTRAFLGSRLLYLHVLLDLPLMLLWVGSSLWYRQPMVALGGYNLW